MSWATVFGGTGFLGRRVVRHLADSGTMVRIVSRHRGLGEDAGIERIAADAHDQRSVRAAVAGAEGVVISLYVEHGADLSARLFDGGLYHAMPKARSSAIFVRDNNSRGVLPKKS